MEHTQTNKDAAEEDQTTPFKTLVRIWTATVSDSESSKTTQACAYGHIQIPTIDAKATKKEN